MQNLAGFLLCMEKEDVKPMDTNTEFLRREDIETQLMVTRTTLYRWIESHGFPRPHQTRRSGEPLVSLRGGRVAEEPATGGYSEQRERDCRSGEIKMARHRLGVPGRAHRRRTTFDERSTP